MEFCETDSAGIAHFSSLAIYMEQAEHALFRSLGLSVFPQGNFSATNTSKLASIPSSPPSATCSETKNSSELLPTSNDNADEHNNNLLVTWPRVHISLDFVGPARFEELLKIDVLVSKLGESSITFEHIIHGPNHPVARGTSISVCCRIDRPKSHGLIKQPIPQPIRDKLKTFLRTHTQ